MSNFFSPWRFISEEINLATDCWRRITLIDCPPREIVELMTLHDVGAGYSVSSGCMRSFDTRDRRGRGRIAQAIAQHIREGLQEYHGILQYPDVEFVRSISDRGAEMSHHKIRIEFLVLTPQRKTQFLRWALEENSVIAPYPPRAVWQESRLALTVISGSQRTAQTRSGESQRPEWSLSLPCLLVAARHMESPRVPTAISGSRNITETRLGRSLLPER
jgi:hypothetical protein